MTPGRWHNYGQKVLYFCSSLALCVLELKANSVSFSAIRGEYHYINIEIDHAPLLIEEVPNSFYKKEWILNRQLTQRYGNDWFKSGRTNILKVCSAVLPTDSNFILNTTLPEFSELKFSKPMRIPLDIRVI